MSWDINQVTIIGRLTRDPELRYGKTGVAFCNFSIAVGRKSTREGSEDEVSYFDVVTIGKTAEIANQYLKKGKQLGVQGYLQQRRWEDQNGQKKYKVEIFAERVQFLGSSERSDKQDHMDNPPYDPTIGASQGEPFEDDEIPF